MEESFQFCSKTKFQEKTQQLHKAALRTDVSHRSVSEAMSQDKRVLNTAFFSTSCL